jgi:hypothetical protein
MDDMMSAAPLAAPDQAGFEAWCDCVRRLLGWSEGAGEDWAALYATGHTPRDAARTTIYGDTAGD